MFYWRSSITEEQMQKHTVLCEDAIARHDAQKMVEQTTAVARLANRVLQVAKWEADNSEDPEFIAAVNHAADNLQSGELPNTKTEAQLYNFFFFTIIVQFNKPEFPKDYKIVMIGS